MKNLTMRSAVALSAALVSSYASAVGFIIVPPSQVAGINNAGSAAYEGSVASIANNPAAMSLIQHKLVGSSLAIAVPDWEVNEKWDCSFEDNCAKSNSSNVAVLPAMGLIRPMDYDFTWGLALGAAAGTGLEYGDSWKGRGLITENSVQVLALENALSWRMNDRWTFGAGIGVLYGEYSQDQDLPSINDSLGKNIGAVYQLVGDLHGCQGLSPIQRPRCVLEAVDNSGLDRSDAEKFAENVANIQSYAAGNSGTVIEQEGDDLGVKLSLGLTYQPHENHRFGLVYHYMSDFTFEGNTDIKGKLLSDEEFQSPHSTLSWSMPDRVIVSGAHQFGANTQLFWDFERVFFDEFESTDLRIDGYVPLHVDRNFKDANRYAVGIEYALDPALTLQAGFSYHESPVDKQDRLADIPVVEITKVSVGGLYQVNQDLTVNGYFIYETLGDGDVQQLLSIDGHKIGKDLQLDSDVVIYLFGASFTYRF